MPDPETPQSLHRFFMALDLGNADDEDDKLNFASPGVVKRGRLAAEMLLAIQETLGLDSAAPPPAENDGSRLKIDALTKEIATVKSEGVNLIEQNLKLVDENTELKQKIQNLHRQVNRLYDKAEMASILERIQKQGAESSPADEVSGGPSDLQQELEEESAQRITDETPAAEPAATSDEADDDGRKAAASIDLQQNDSADEPPQQALDPAPNQDS